MSAEEKAEAVSVSAAILARKLASPGAAGFLPPPSPSKGRRLVRSKSHSSVPRGSGGGAGGAGGDDDDDAGSGDPASGSATPGRRKRSRRRKKRHNSQRDGSTPPRALSRSGSHGSDVVSIASSTAASPAQEDSPGQAAPAPPLRPGAWSSSQGRGGALGAAAPGSPSSPRSPLFERDAGRLSPKAAGAAAAALLVPDKPGDDSSGDDEGGGHRRGAPSNTAGDPTWKMRWFDEAAGGRQRHSTLPLIQQSHEMRRKAEQSIIRFNVNVRAGVRFATESGVAEDSPEGVAEFLLTAEGLSKERVGQYLGGHDPFQQAVLFAYVNRLDFRKRSFVDALRYFLSGFRLPGEAQQIDRMMEKFSERFCRDNPGVFASQDAGYLLAYSLIMLNTDAHSDRVRQKMSKSQFVRNCRGLTDEGISPAFLSQCYNEIVEREIRVDYDYLEQLYARIQANEMSSVRYTIRRRRSMSAVTLSAQPCTSVKDSVQADARRAATAHARRHSAAPFASFGGGGGTPLSQAARHAGGSVSDPAALAAERKERSIAEVSSSADEGGGVGGGGGGGGGSSVGLGDPPDEDDEEALVFDFRRLAHLGKLSGGNVFMKHGRRGAPHPRKVWLSDDMTEISWQDPEQSSPARSVRVADIVDVRVGRDTTQVFQRAAAGIHDTKDALCFSVVLRGRTLDLEADRPDEVRQWVDFLTQVVEENVLRAEAQGVAARRARRERDIVTSVDEWRTFMFRRWGDYQDRIARGGRGKLVQRFRRVWLRGIPPSVRCRAWPKAIGNVLEITPELFEAFLHMARTNQRAALADGGAGSSQAFLGVRESALQLQRDLPQTFPELGFFHSGGEHLMKDQLREVLQAYMFYRPDIGYMHGLSHIAAMLLLYVDFADAFVALANLLHSHYFLSVCRMDMDQLRWRFAYFDQGMERFLPDLRRHFDHLRLSPEMYLVDWCLALYARTLPLDVASRVWDMYLLQGEVVVYRTGLAILAYFQRQLLRSTLDDCLLLLRDARDGPVDEERFWGLVGDAAGVLADAEFDRLLADHTGSHSTSLQRPLR